MPNDDFVPTERLEQELRREVHFGPGARARVMAAVHRERARIARPGWLSPMLASALAASLLIAAIGGRMLQEPRSSVSMIAADTGAAISAGIHDSLLLVRFALHAPAAARVALVGDFNDWRVSATPLVRAERRGTWSADVPLGRGEHLFAFVVDDTQWVADAGSSARGPTDRAASRIVVPLPQ